MFFYFYASLVKRKTKNLWVLAFDFSLLSCCFKFFFPVIALTDREMCGGIFPYWSRASLEKKNLCFDFNKII